MIDRLRQVIQDRLDQLLGEAKKLRDALASEPSRRVVVRTAQDSSTGACGAPQKPARPALREARRERRAGALRDGQAMAARELVAAAGLPRPTVSTTLTRMARTGEVVRAERGYRLPARSETAAAGTEASAS